MLIIPYICYRLTKLIATDKCLYQRLRVNIHGLSIRNNDDAICKIMEKLTSASYLFM